MKKTFLKITMASALLISISAKAQIKLGVQAGINSSSATISGLSNLKNITAPKAGLITEFKLMQGLLFRPAINFEQFGNIQNTITNLSGGITNTIAQTQKINAIEIPLELTVPLKLGKGKLLLSAAPTATIGLSGTNTGTNTTQVGSGTAVVNPINSNINFGTATTELKKLDWGTRFGLGYQLSNGIQLNATYNVGLTNLSNASSGSYKTHNLGVTIGYFFIK
jgi:Outer membrane protein beta-barrel domain